jgi:hypothetical protein
VCANDGGKPKIGSSRQEESATEEATRAGSSISIVSARRKAWRESVILGRASGPIRNRGAYLRVAMPQFVADELNEIRHWLAARLVEEIDANHPSVVEMKTFLQKNAQCHDLPVPDELIEEVIVVGYFKWKARIIASGLLEGRTD